MLKNKKHIIAEKAIFALKAEYPEAKCSLLSESPLQLLIAARLSAQCTDDRVNKTTPALFAKFKNAQDFANSDIKILENCIKSCGLYKTKAKDIKNMCSYILENFDGKIPDTISELTKLPGIGRKTANLILAEVFDKPAYIVDTHCIRITGRLGLHDVKTKDANKIEKILRELIPPLESRDFFHRVVSHGRAVCKAINPICQRCCLKEICKSFEQNNE